MSPWLIVAALLLSAVASLLFSTISYALRDLSRPRLAEALERKGRSQHLDPTIEHAGDLIFLTAVGRMFANMFVLLTALWLTGAAGYGTGTRYTLAAVIAGLIMLFFSVAVPNSLAKHAGHNIVASVVVPLHLMRRMLAPLTKLMHLVDDAVRRASGTTMLIEPADAIQQEILSAVEEGEKEGLVGEEEREMIESVIKLRATTAGQVMTPRPEIIALDITSTLSQVKQTLEESGHSRIPVYDGTIDHVVGILYARDLLKFLGQATLKFDIRSAMRPAYFVPEVKPVRDLLHDFRVQKVHIAIVLDEYGGTSGLVTIEDVLEELVGDISDEHEPLEPAMFKRLSENAAEADARMYVDQLNRLMGLNIPEDAGYDTLGGFVTTTLGRIPEPGEEFEYDGARFTVLDAEPQKVNRVRIELIPQPAETAEPAPTGM
jgi:putative hemolysin